MESEDASPSASWESFAGCLDVLRVVCTYLDAPSKRALRAACRTARAGIDATVDALSLEFPHEDGEEDAPGYIKNANSDDPLRREDEARSESLYLASTAARDFPGLGACWPAASSVAVHSCLFSQLTVCLVEGAAERWPLLRRLTLSGCRLGRYSHDAALAALTSQTWPRLEVLEVMGCGLMCGDVGALAALVAPDLRELDLSDNRLETVVGLAGASWPLLDTLALCRNPGLCLRGSLAALASAFPLLEDLDLSGCQLGRADLESIMATPWKSLSWLTLQRCGLKDDDMAGLGGSAPVPTDGAAAGAAAAGTGSVRRCMIERLDLMGNALYSAAGIRALAAATAAMWPRLLSLDLSSQANMRGDALAALDGTHWPSLRSFEASNMVLSVPAVQGLVGARMPALRRLTLRNSIVSWNAVDHLALGKWPLLRRLDLGGENGVHLRRAGPSLAGADWPQLRWLVLRAAGSSRIKTTNRKALLLLHDKWPDLRARFN